MFSRRNVIVTSSQPPRARWVCALSAILVSISVARGQQVDVCVNFAGSGIGGGAQAAVLAKIQGHYNAAGLGVGNPQRVIFHNSTAPPPAGCRLFVGFGVIGGPILGISNKATHVARISIPAINLALGAAFGGCLNLPTRRCRAWAEVIAHEVGHLLCATHQCVGPGAKRTVLGVTPCVGAPTLVSDGTCISRGQMGNCPGVLSFNALSTLQIRAGVLRIVGPGPAWALAVGGFLPGALYLVEGISHTQPLEFNDELTSVWDPLIDFEYSLSGNLELFEFGWMNADGEFVEPLDAKFNPDQLLEAGGGTFLDFAIRGRAGTPFEGLVFDQINHGTVTFSGQSNRSAAAATPGVTGKYFSAVTIDFLIKGNPFSIFLDTGNWGAENGFTQLEAQPPIGGCCLPEGLCLDTVSQEACAKFGGTYLGDGIGCPGPECVPCPWDLDNNGVVGGTDLLSLLVNWGPYEPCPPFKPADFDQNCSVGATDLLALLVNWGPCP